MGGIGSKRKAASSLVEFSKTTRVEDTRAYGYDDEEDIASTYAGDGDSEDGQSQTADTPLTPFSPSRKFPSDLKTIKCTYEGCTKTFNRPARLISHLRSHTNERPFFCRYAECDKSYMEEKHLKQHIKGSHTHEKSYQCDWYGCSKSFLTATRLRRHREAHEGHERFRCTVYPPCNQTFRKHQTLQRHIRATHLELFPFPCAQTDSDTGVICSAGFDSAGALRKHEDRVHGALRYWCDECSNIKTTGTGKPHLQFGFRTKTELTKHIRTEHSNCIFCDKKFGNQAALQKHLEVEHSNAEGDDRAPEKKSYPCTYPGCLKTFTKKYNLSVHFRSLHNRERFICCPSSTISSTFKSPEVASWKGGNACGKDFVSKVNLEDHIRTQHLGLPSVVNAKRIKSENYGIQNSQRRKRRRDEDDDMEAINLLTGTSYGQDDTRKIPCLIVDCPWRFTRQYDLKLHLKAKHGDSVPEYEQDSELFPPSSLSYPEMDDPNDYNALDDQVDLEWSMRGKFTNENTHFWVGADTADGPEDESWSKEEAEMRRLIDDDFVDPALRGI